MHHVLLAFAASCSLTFVSGSLLTGGPVQEPAASRAQSQPTSKPAASKKGTMAEAKELLSKLLDPATDRIQFGLALRPASADYKALYVGDAVKKAADEYERLWARMGSTDPGIGPKEGQTQLKVWSATTEDFRAWNESGKQFPGGYKDVAQQLAPGVTWYRFKFVKPGEDAGMAFDALVFVNDHWVLVPRPWRPLK